MDYDYYCLLNHGKLNSYFPFFVLFLLCICAFSEYTLKLKLLFALGVNDRYERAHYIQKLLKAKRIIRKNGGGEFFGRMRSIIVSFSNIIKED